LGLWMGYGWNPYLWEVAATSAQQKERYIDLIDAKKKELVWEGQGVGYLTQNREQKKN
jgi:hypothetical protein